MQTASTTETSPSLWSCKLFYRFRTQPVATGVNATGGVQRTPHRTHAYAHFSRAHFTRDDCTCSSRLSVLRVSQNHSYLIMSLLDVPFRPFPLIFCSSTCSLTRPSASSTPLTGFRRPPCATPPWRGMSGHLANPIPDTKNVLRDIANWRTKRQSSYAKSQVLAWMITISRKRNLNQLEN